MHFITCNKPSNGNWFAALRTKYAEEKCLNLHCSFKGSFGAVVRYNVV